MTKKYEFSTNPDATGKISRFQVLLKYLLCFAGGGLYALALPPCNWEWCAYLCFVPLLAVLDTERGWKKSAIFGYFWGLGWSIFAMQFLREIFPACPYLVAMVLAIWSAVWSALLPHVRKTFWGEDSGFWRTTLGGLVVATLFVGLEWTRSHLFTWDDLSVTQYRNLPLIQNVVWGGRYAVALAVALVNVALFVLIFRRKAWKSAIALLLPVALMYTFGALKLYRVIAPPPPPDMTWRVLAIQGDMSQPRNAQPNSTAKILDTYVSMTRQATAANSDFDVVVWPESAVPVILYRQVDFSRVPMERLNPYLALVARYQAELKKLANDLGKPLIIGALDYRINERGEILDTYNGALLVLPERGFCEFYAKMHRVPFGEYIPFRDWMPDCVIEFADMGRNLTPGVNPRFAKLPDGVVPGMSICYEGVFGYHIREVTAAGANVLLALSNDGWYPLSSEPEQHLANATMRAIEVGLPMARCGNYGGTGVLMPDGRFTQCPLTPGGEVRRELGRGAATVVLEVPVVKNPAPTIYLLCGEFFAVSLLTLSIILWFAPIVIVAYRRRCQAHGE